MDGFNRVTLTGTVKGLPVCRGVPPDNRPFCKASVDTAGTQVTVVWRDEEAERMGRELEDKTTLMVDGALKIADWETQQDGRRELVIIEADVTQIISQPYVLEDRP